MKTYSKSSFKRVTNAFNKRSIVSFGKSTWKYVCVFTAGALVCYLCLGVGMPGWSEKEKSRLAAEIEKKIGSPAITAQFLGETLFLEGVAANEFEADRAVEISRALLGAPSENIRVPASGATCEDGKVQNPALVDLLRIKPRR